MPKLNKIIVMLFFMLGWRAQSLATNGDNLIGIGPASRAMGGTGIAAPQDAIGAVFSNPAAICFGPYCPGAEVEFAATVLVPQVEAEIIRGDGSVFRAKSDEKAFLAPAFAISVPLGDRWRFGLGAYGVTGLGVDYRDSALSGAIPGTNLPLVATDFTQLQVLKVAPSLAVRIGEGFSAGAALHIDYSSLDLKNGGDFGYGAGVQLGLLWKPTDGLSVGATYITEQNVDHHKVLDIDGDGKPDDASFAAPQTVGFGISIEPLHSLVLSADVKWLNWSDAKGYDDLDWDDQIVIAFGVQYKPTQKLLLRAGYNFSENQVNAHNGFDGQGTSFMQGKPLPTYYFETFRIIGFPAIAEHHVTCGIGYEWSEKLAIHVGYKHAFETTIRETGRDITGTPVKLESSLQENAFDLGIAWRF